MISRKNPWYDSQERQQQLEAYVSRAGAARFGFTVYRETEKVDRVKRHFDTIAAYYDRMNTILSFGMHYLWKRAAVATLDIQPGDRVLDVCGGTGDMAKMSAEKTGAEGMSIVYDINWRMIEEGRKKECHKVAFVQGDAEKLAFPDNTFDAVSVGFGIRNITHLEQGFRELFRILKPGGKMCCLEFSKPDNIWFRYLYDVYSFEIMPALGGLITGDREAYTVFPESIRAFPLPDELTRILRSIGFHSIQVKKLTNGIAVIHSGTR